MYIVFIEVQVVAKSIVNPIPQDLMIDFVIKDSSLKLASKTLIA